MAPWVPIPNQVSQHTHTQKAINIHPSRLAPLLITYQQDPIPIPLGTQVLSDKWVKVKIKITNCCHQYLFTNAQHIQDQNPLDFSWDLTTNLLYPQVQTPYTSPQKWSHQIHTQYSRFHIQIWYPNNQLQPKPSRQIPIDGSSMVLIIRYGLPLLLKTQGILLLCLIINRATSLDLIQPKGRLSWVVMESNWAWDTKYKEFASRALKKQIGSPTPSPQDLPYKALDKDVSDIGTHDPLPHTKTKPNKYQNKSTKTTPTHKNKSKTNPTHHHPVLPETVMIGLIYPKIKVGTWGQGVELPVSYHHPKRAYKKWSGSFVAPKMASYQRPIHAKSPRKSSRGLKNGDGMGMGVWVIDKPTGNRGTPYKGGLGWGGDWWGLLPNLPVFPFGVGCTGGSGGTTASHPSGASGHPQPTIQQINHYPSNKTKSNLPMVPTKLGSQPPNQSLSPSTLTKQGFNGYCKLQASLTFPVQRLLPDTNVPMSSMYITIKRGLWVLIRTGSLNNNPSISTLYLVNKIGGFHLPNSPRSPSGVDPHQSTKLYTNNPFIPQPSPTPFGQTTTYNHPFGTGSKKTVHQYLDILPVLDDLKVRFGMAPVGILGGPDEGGGAYGLVWVPKTTLYTPPIQPPQNRVRQREGGGVCWFQSSIGGMGTIKSNQRWDGLPTLGWDMGSKTLMRGWGIYLLTISRRCKQAKPSCRGIAIANSTLLFLSQSTQGPSRIGDGYRVHWCTNNRDPGSDPPTKLPTSTTKPYQTSPLSHPDFNKQIPLHNNTPALPLRPNNHTTSTNHPLGAAKNPPFCIAISSTKTNLIPNSPQQPSKAIPIPIPTSLLYKSYISQYHPIPLKTPEGPLPTYALPNTTIPCTHNYPKHCSSSLKALWVLGVGGVTIKYKDNLNVARSRSQGPSHIPPTPLDRQPACVEYTQILQLVLLIKANYIGWDGWRILVHNPDVREQSKP
ncbi:hypothetical protein G9A89_000236 [Geosiphon pyriformis]|nr:hypothetical protein G9A89_000236 [Geosiphon pyriformis]